MGTKKSRNNIVSGLIYSYQQTTKSVTFHDQKQRNFGIKSYENGSDHDGIKCPNNRENNN